MSNSERKVKRSNVNAVLRRRDIRSWETAAREPYLKPNAGDIISIEDLMVRRDLRIQAEVMLGTLVIMEQTPEMIRRFVMAVNESEDYKKDLEDGKIIDINSRRNRK